jgi:hypothetical protein
MEIVFKTNVLDSVPDLQRFGTDLDPRIRNTELRSKSYAFLRERSSRVVRLSMSESLQSWFDSIILRHIGSGWGKENMDLGGGRRIWIWVGEGEYGSGWGKEKKC